MMAWQQCFINFEFYTLLRRLETMALMSFFTIITSKCDKCQSDRQKIAESFKIQYLSYRNETLSINSVINKKKNNINNFLP